MEWFVEYLNTPLDNGTMLAYIAGFSISYKFFGDK